MFAGVIGSKQISFTLDHNDQNTNLTLHNKTAPIIIPIWLCCSQRVSKRLKTCDLILISSDQLIEITIGQKDLGTLLDGINCAHYDVGADPLPWKRIHKNAIQNKWTIDDWQEYFEPIEEEEDEDEEWKPEDDAYSSSSSDEEDN
jgi:hypothetical protein